MLNCTHQPVGGYLPFPNGGLVVSRFGQKPTTTIALGTGGFIFSMTQLRLDLNRQPSHIIYVSSPSCEKSRIGTKESAPSTSALGIHKTHFILHYHPRSPDVSSNSFHLRAVTDEACSPGRQDRIFLRGRALVVLLSPNEIPRGCDDEKGEKDDRSVVHKVCGYRNCSRHAKERDSEG